MFGLEMKDKGRHFSKIYSQSVNRHDPRAFRSIALRATTEPTRPLTFGTVSVRTQALSMRKGLPPNECSLRTCDVSGRNELPRLSEEIPGCAVDLHLRI